MMPLEVLHWTWSSGFCDFAKTLLLMLFIL